MKDICDNNKRLMMGGGRMEEGGKKNDPKIFETVDTGGSKISVKY